MNNENNENNKIELICCYKQKGKKECKKICENNSNYCKIHQNLNGKRIKCEYCKQMINIIKIKKHENNCDKNKKNNKNNNLKYYEEKINNPFKILKKYILEVKEEKEDEEEKEKEEKEEEIDVNRLILKINEIYNVYIYPMLGERRQNREINYVKPSDKHRSQELMMYNYMLSHGIINSNNIQTNNIFLDLGSGKGCLSKTISLQTQENSDNSIFICIEKETYKHKAERSSNSLTYRAQINIEDVKINELIKCTIPEDKLNQGYSIIGMGKHLCGNATDIAIVSLTNVENLNGICIALCCHSNCQYNSTLVTKWLNSLPLNQQITSTEWKYLKKWSGMFTLNERERELDEERRNRKIHNIELEGKEEEENKEEKEIQIEVERDLMNEMLYEERVSLGLKCKRIIDYGRIMYIQQEMQLNAQLVYYTDEEITPENVLLLAWKS